MSDEVPIPPVPPEGDPSAAPQPPVPAAEGAPAEPQAQSPPAGASPAGPSPPEPRREVLPVVVMAVLIALLVGLVAGAVVLGSRSCGKQESSVVQPRAGTAPVVSATASPAPTTAPPPSATASPASEIEATPEWPTPADSLSPSSDAWVGLWVPVGDEGFRFTVKADDGGGYAVFDARGAAIDIDSVGSDVLVGRVDIMERVGSQDVRISTPVVLRLDRDRERVTAVAWSDGQIRTWEARRSQ